MHEFSFKGCDDLIICEIKNSGTGTHKRKDMMDSNDVDDSTVTEKLCVGDDHDGLKQLLVCVGNDDQTFKQLQVCVGNDDHQGLGLDQSYFVNGLLNLDCWNGIGDLECSSSVLQHQQMVS
ncbi:hypothetical protein COLO4_25104 [Corchorus olitorius]|uniref:Uncharacterized protein n=1 Tax=Corchorus olitorius TaxID=93759 RepID=A0A1R3I4K8_9ROSI|nr:hypothetical protein COLO4_25104 [Corchorus olitorius]